MQPSYIYQQPIITPEQQIQLQEMIYFVFQDLQNTLGVYAETVASINFFELDSLHPYVNIAYNRLILQFNLSNSILYDQTLHYKNDNLLNTTFHDLKKKAKEYLNMIKQQILSPNTYIDNLINHHLNNTLSNQQGLAQLPSQVFDIPSNIDQKIFDKIFQAMQKVDDDLLRIRQGEQLIIPTADDVFAKIVTRYHNAQEQLKKNFPSEYERMEQQKLAKQMGFA